MKSRQIAALFLAAVLALSLIGCGETPPGAETNTAQGGQQIPGESSENPEATEAPMATEAPEESEELKESEGPGSSEASAEPGSESEARCG